jgi:hypothetical protein
VTAYAVQRTCISRAGPYTVYAQQWHQLRQTGTAKPDPHTLFWEDLSQHIQEYQRTFHDIILMIDANVTVDSRNNPLSKMIQALSLIDCHTHCNPNTLEPPPSTYIRGTKRLDYILCSPRI